MGIAKRIRTISNLLRHLYTHCQGCGVELGAYTTVERIIRAGKKVVIIQRCVECDKFLMSLD